VTYSITVSVFHTCLCAVMIGGTSLVLAAMLGDLVTHARNIRLRLAALAWQAESKENEQ